MPPLRQLECNVRAADTKNPFREYGVEYKDGLVVCYCLIPDSVTKICITLEAQEYIAPGLAAVVYVDGNYQANRSVRGLKRPADSEAADTTKVKFEFHQKESFMPDGRIVASPWVLYPLTERADTGTLIDTDSSTSGQFSVIEVVVLRCGHNDLMRSTSPFEIAPPDNDRTGLETYRSWARRQSTVRHKDGGSHDDASEPSEPKVNETAYQNLAHPRKGADPSWMRHNTSVFANARQLQKSNPEQFEAKFSKLFDKDHLQGESTTTPGPQPSIFRAKDTAKSGSPSKDIQTVLQYVHTVTSDWKSKPSHTMIKGPTYQHMHSLAVPRYLDSVAKPYAKFVFHYRNRDTLISCPGVKIDLAYEEAIKEFEGKSKEEVIAELIAQRKAIASKKEDGVEDTPSKDDGWPTVPEPEKHTSPWETEKQDDDTTSKKDDAWNLFDVMQEPDQDKPATTKDDSANDTTTKSDNGWNDSGAKQDEEKNESVTKQAENSNDPVVKQDDGWNTSTADAARLSNLMETAKESSLKGDSTKSSKKAGKIVWTAEMQAQMKSIGPRPKKPPGVLKGEQVTNDVLLKAQADWDEKKNKIKAGTFTEETEAPATTKWTPGELPKSSGPDVNEKW